MSRPGIFKMYYDRDSIHFLHFNGEFEIIAVVMTILYVRRDNMRFRHAIMFSICALMVGCSAMKPHELPKKTYHNTTHQFSISYDRAFKPIQAHSNHSLTRHVMIQKIMGITATPQDTPMDLQNPSNQQALFTQLEISNASAIQPITIQNTHGIKVSNQVQDNHYWYYFFIRNHHLIAFSFKSSQPNMQWAEDIMATLHWINP